MKMVWRGIDTTFRSAFGQQGRISEKESNKKLSSMVLELRASTPEDTGYARSRWALEGVYPYRRVKNDADYIQRLNEGWSKQAPSFFVESVALRFGRPLGKITTVVP